MARVDLHAPTRIEHEGLLPQAGPGGLGGGGEQRVDLRRARRDTDARPGEHSLRARVAILGLRRGEDRPLPSVREVRLERTLQPLKLAFVEQEADRGSKDVCATPGSLGAPDREFAPRRSLRRRCGDVVRVMLCAPSRAIADDLLQRERGRRHDARPSSQTRSPWRSLDPHPSALGRIIDARWSAGEALIL
ncbi:hypothetical protein OV203_26855 [Nannocystis sp. ILAH1]|uniref:hypothetical protein n=1 Tax=unclassified Nannocystis TaxID=2627009 RepID=UPI00226D9505|nr:MULTISPECIES: hypothetical protein [unclassified Nannocystis]MCY0990794.1 hypothetical protein [Nannocystis sp. ILAH1]MCY1072324.1 hypothetical protein [Nannocystis sp. RBIL2]